VRPGWLALGEDVPVGDLLARVLAAPLRDHVGNIGYAHAEMKDSLAASMALGTS
jgi:hypothetical protein